MGQKKVFYIDEVSVLISEVVQYLGWEKVSCL